ncbi:unnamed protein product [Blepharisma stoltei]|uniref:Cytochrome c oxidase assembly factor 5 n=1 Tax=Blepharisma stoltei TaxID=1481888 RepID=A0AAU9J7H6_9CILI|nr:unnamed protein product [Blepharisma stoltei]
MVGFIEKISNWLKTGDTSKPVNKTCHDPAKDLVECISQTDCFEKGGTLKYCARNDDNVAHLCKKELNEWFLCRKFSVDHSKHFVKDTYR